MCVCVCPCILPFCTAILAHKLLFNVYSVNPLRHYSLSKLSFCAEFPNRGKNGALVGVGQKNNHSGSNRLYFLSHMGILFLQLENEFSLRPSHPNCTHTHFLHSKKIPHSTNHRTKRIKINKP